MGRTIDWRAVAIASGTLLPGELLDGWAVVHMNTTARDKRTAANNGYPYFKVVAPVGTKLS
jgi:hypothetical protein